MSQALKRIEDFKQQVLNELLNQCTPEQQNLFDRMYGNLRKVPKDEFEKAIQQCELTIIKNNRVQGLVKEEKEL